MQEASDEVVDELAEAYRQLELLVHRRTDELTEVNRKFLEAQVLLVHVEKMASLGQLSASLAHEINNPLAYLNSNLNSLREYLPILAEGGNEKDHILAEAMDALNDCQEGVSRMKGVVATLQDFSRRDQPDTQLSDVNEGIEATLKLVMPHVKTSCVVHKDLSPVAPIACDLGALNQVFLNLLMNAFQAVSESGAVWVSSSQKEGWVQVAIRDNGRGIDKENLPLIFDPFFTTKKKGEGTGLGLAISDQIVKMHQGKIVVESEPGKGTCFTVCLPAQPCVS